MKIGFIGLGRMGFRMAKRLLENNIDLTVYNRTREKSEALKKFGAKISSSPKELAQAVDVIITMVSDEQAVNDVLFGDNGAVLGAKKGSIFIDMTTMHAEASKRIASVLRKKVFEFLDAPVIGSINSAESGTLIILVGGKKEILNKVMPIFKILGKKVYYLGENGSACYAKVIYNSLIASFVAILGEDLMIAKKAGLDISTVLEILNHSVFEPAIKKYTKRMLDSNREIRFTLSLMTKDLEYTTRTAYELAIPLQIISTVKEVYQTGKSIGFENEDYTGIYDVLKKLSGIK